MLHLRSARPLVIALPQVIQPACLPASQLIAIACRKMDQEGRPVNVARESALNSVYHLTRGLSLEQRRRENRMIRMPCARFVDKLAIWLLIARQVSDRQA